MKIGKQGEQNINNPGYSSCERSRNRWNYLQGFTFFKAGHQECRYESVSAFGNCTFQSLWKGDVGMRAGAIEQADNPQVIPGALFADLDEFHTFSSADGDPKSLGSPGKAAAVLRRISVHDRVLPDNVSCQSHVPRKHPVI